MLHNELKYAKSYRIFCNCTFEAAAYMHDVDSFSFLVMTSRSNSLQMFSCYCSSESASVVLVKTEAKKYFSKAYFIIVIKLP